MNDDHRDLITNFRSLFNDGTTELGIKCLSITVMAEKDKTEDGEKCFSLGCLKDRNKSIFHDVLLGNNGWRNFSIIM